MPVYYFAGRIAFNLFLGRGFILNWIRELGQAGLSIIVVLLLYIQIIEDRDTLMPEASAIVSEMWIIVALFIYAILNGVEFKSKGATRRSNRYICDAFDRYRALYSSIVASELPTDGTRPDPFIESVVYSVMIYEGFNRPPHIQKIERWIQRATPRTPRTLGPMQVRSVMPMTDEESVREGVRRIVGVFEREGWVRSNGHPDLYEVAAVVYRDYNPDDHYVEDVTNIHETVVRQQYPELAPETEESGI